MVRSKDCLSCGWWSVSLDFRLLEGAKLQVLLKLPEIGFGLRNVEFNSDRGEWSFGVFKACVL